MGMMHEGHGKVILQPHRACASCTFVKCHVFSCFPNFNHNYIAKLAFTQTQNRTKIFEANHEAQASFGTCSDKASRPERVMAIPALSILINVLECLISKSFASCATILALPHDIGS